MILSWHRSLVNLAIGAAWECPAVGHGKGGGGSSGRVAGSDLAEHAHSDLEESGTVVCRISSEARAVSADCH